MLRVVQSQAPHSPDVLRRKGREERADVGDLIGHVVLPEDVTGDDPGLRGLANVRDACGQDGIAVVDTAVLCQETD